MSIRDYFFAAVLVHVNRQQIATGPSYSDAELREKFDEALSLPVPPEISSEIIARLEREGFAEIVRTSIGRDYIKLSYPKIREVVLAQSERPETYIYHYNKIGHQLLIDSLDIYNSGGLEPPVEPKGDIEAPPNFSISEERRVHIVQELDTIQRSLDENLTDNAKKAQATALVGAVQKLAEAPEPPYEVMWSLLQRANAIAGIASLFVAIMALFVH